MIQLHDRPRWRLWTVDLLVLLLILFLLFFFLFGATSSKSVKLERACITWQDFCSSSKYASILLTESDFRFDVIISRWRPWRYFMQKVPPYAAAADVRAAILKLWRQIENPTPSIDAYYLKYNPAKIHPGSILNYRALAFLKSIVPATTRTTTTTTTVWVAICDQFLI